MKGNTEYQSIPEFVKRGIKSLAAIRKATAEQLAEVKSEREKQKLEMDEERSPPAMNIHRSPFSGRNYEYYSEDGLHSGKMAAAETQGIQSQGVTTYCKHFAVNDQESNRDSGGLLTWVNEQAMREIYIKPFEIAVKEGGTRGIMSSFNRIGEIW